MNWFRLLFSRTCVIYGAGHRGHIPWRCETICCLPCNRWHGRSCSEHKHPTEGSDERGRWNIHVYTPYLLVEKKKTCLRSSVYKDRRNGFRSTRRLMEGKKSEGGSEQWRIARGSKPVGISKKKKKKETLITLSHTHTLSLSYVLSFTWYRRRHTIYEQPTLASGNLWTRMIFSDNPTNIACVLSMKSVRLVSQETSPRPQAGTQSP